MTSRKRPNFLVIMGDDIGWMNPSCYHRGMMGYWTPNIDRIAEGGALFTDWYGQQSCTAGRAAFITGQCPIRPGLTKVGLPGADVGIQPEDPTIAEILEPLGYVSGQFGKNHLGDQNKFLPTVHGFSEFFGNLYHLNAEEEPEDPKYPKDPRFKEMFGPRGVLKAKATRTDDATEEKRWGRVGPQQIEDTGPLTKKRMETVDEEFTAAALDFIERQAKADQPFFCWMNTTRMHVWTHLKPDSQGVTGKGLYPDGMVELDGFVGQFLNKLEALGIDDNTVVVFTTDNGAEVLSYPDGGQTPFRGEKATNWEGAFRVPCVIRWPGVIQPGSIINDVCAHEDLMVTFAAAAGDAEVKQKCLKGNYTANGKTFHVHLDGYNLLDALKAHKPGPRPPQGSAEPGKSEFDQWPRQEFIYWNDDGQLCGIRLKDIKLNFLQQLGKGLDVWTREFTNYRIPRAYNLRSDPFERADESGLPFETSNQLYYLVPAQAVVGKWLQSFKEFPPRQKSASFNVDAVVEKIMDGALKGPGR
ncbi:arylsulfatase [Stenotrophomonas sp.]|uniref:arylsulfatase n=1 Tax=Stenotrophomonas sp. TaxID=69392 RepID=UPI0028AE946B|nr:arylsulfatase [Stenotrophomonas sp.]